jgi:hypothetical protein
MDVSCSGLQRRVLSSRSEKQWGSKTCLPPAGNQNLGRPAHGQTIQCLHTLYHSSGDFSSAFIRNAVLLSTELTVTAHAHSPLDANTHLKQKTVIFIHNYISISSKGVKFLSPFWFDTRTILTTSATFHHNSKPTSVLCVRSHSDISRFKWGSNWKYSHITEFFGFMVKRVRSSTSPFWRRRNGCGWQESLACRHNLLLMWFFQ